MRRVALLLEYDGARFAGSQLQKDVPTVQSVLEEAIERTTGEQSRVAFAGRTDSGVHARGQVASFFTATRLEPDVLQRALNARLPADVVVRAAAEAAETLDVRRDARKRHYRYVIDNGSVRPALGYGGAWHVPGGLDVPAMAAASQRLLGCHDFAAFAGPLERSDASTVRILYGFEVQRCGRQIMLDLTGSAFLPHQVRRMTGALVEVGRGKLDADDYAALLDGPPSSAGPSAPPHGLYLMQVDYETPLFGEALDSAMRFC